MQVSYFQRVIGYEAVNAIEKGNIPRELLIVENKKGHINVRWLKLFLYTSYYSAQSKNEMKSIV